MKVYTKSIKNNSFYEVGTKTIFKNFPPILFWSIFFFFCFCFQILWWCSRIFLYFSFPQSLLVDFIFFIFLPTLISIARLSLSPYIISKPLPPTNYGSFPSLSVFLCFHRIFFILTAIKIIKKKILNYHLFSMKNLHL